MLARCTSTVDAAPSSISADRVSFLRLRTAAAAAVVRKKFRRGIDFVTLFERYFITFRGFPLGKPEMPNCGADPPVRSRCPRRLPAVWMKPISWAKRATRGSRADEGVRPTFVQHQETNYLSSPRSWLMIAGRGPCTASAAANPGPASVPVTVHRSEEQPSE